LQGIRHQQEVLVRLLGQVSPLGEGPRQQVEHQQALARVQGIGTRSQSPAPGGGDLAAGPAHRGQVHRLLQAAALAPADAKRPGRIEPLRLVDPPQIVQGVAGPVP
jgi:hypothetical protein